MIIGIFVMMKGGSVHYHILLVFLFGRSFRVLNPGLVIIDSVEVHYIAPLMNIMTWNFKMHFENIYQY